MEFILRLNSFLNILKAATALRYGTKNIRQNPKNCWCVWCELTYITLYLLKGKKPHSIFTKIKKNPVRGEGRIVFLILLGSVAFGDVGGRCCVLQH